MHPKNLIIKLPWMITLCIAFYFAALYLQHDQALPHEQWHYYISQQQFDNHPSNNRFSALQLAHDGEGHYPPMQLLIKNKWDEEKTFLIDDLNHTHIDEILQVKKHQIKHAIIKSQHPLNFEKQHKVRLLQSTTLDDQFVSVAGKFFSYLLPAIRNLIIIGLFTNEIDLILPVILLSESTTMLAFLDNKKHYLLQFYQNIFNSKADLFNVIRLSMFSSTDSESVNVNPLLLKYGFRKNLLYNVSGEFSVALAFLLATIFIKAGAALLKIQKLREISSKLRGMWNGLLFCLMPRILTFSSFSVRYVSIDSFEGIFYPAVAIVFILIYIVYFVQLVLQIRRINQKVEYIDESRNEIGLVTRISYKHDFEFDCLKFSNLYYPVMNYLRLLLFFVPIGASYDFSYASFGGVIISQLLYIMFSVSSSGFVKSRDSLVYPLCDFLFMILQLAHIAVGLAESVMHSEVSVIAQKVFFSLLLTMTALMVLSLAADIAKKIKDSNIKKGQSEDGIEDKELKTTKFKRSFTKKTAVESKPGSKQTVRTQKKGQVDFLIDESIQDNETDIESPINLKKTMNHVKTKVRKVRQGKII